jgi:hypothetical protein
MCRGDHREPIVQDDVDRAAFRHCLGGAAVAGRDRPHRRGTAGRGLGCRGAECLRPLKAPQERPSFPT